MVAVSCRLGCFDVFSRAGRLIGGVLKPLFPAPKVFFRSFISAVKVLTIEKSSFVVVTSVKSVIAELWTEVDVAVTEANEDEDVESSSMFVVYGELHFSLKCFTRNCKASGWLESSGTSCRNMS